MGNEEVMKRLLRHRLALGEVHAPDLQLHAPMCQLPGYGIGLVKAHAGDLQRRQRAGAVDGAGAKDGETLLGRDRHELTLAFQPIQAGGEQALCFWFGEVPVISGNGESTAHRLAGGT